LEIYTLGSFLPLKIKENANGLSKVPASSLFNGEILKIGGEYNRRYAIIK
jgi:hypothetical protein